MSYSLSRGSSGPQVTALQQALIAKGVMGANDPNGNSNIDGRFGAITHDAVIEFQKTSDLAADGIVGKDTAAALGLALPAPKIKAGANRILTEGQLQRLAELIDALIPTGPADFFDDGPIEWLVLKLDAVLADLLPKKFALMLQELADGLEQGDLRSTRDGLIKAINSRVNVPLLPEDVEARIIGFFVDLVLEALQLGRTFDEALKRLTPRLAHS